MRVLATFATRDIADSMRDLLADHGFDPKDAVVMVNRGGPQPPEDAELEVGTSGPGGFEGLEEKLGKAINEVIGRKNHLEGTGSEGDPQTGALLTLTVANQAEADRAVELLTLHQAGDVEVLQGEGEDLRTGVVV